MTKNDSPTGYLPQDGCRYEARSSLASTQHCGTSVHLLDFSRSVPNLLYSRVLRRIAAEPDWFLFGWESLDFPGPNPAIVSPPVPNLGLPTSEWHQEISCYYH